METAEHIAILDGEGRRMAEVADLVSRDAPVPTCPGWRVRDLLRHLGSVHRWAGEVVAHALPHGIDAIEDRGGPWPEDEALLSWFREGHAALVDALRAAPPDLDCWSFLAAPSPLAFWARRQAHETTVHRVDLELAAGCPSPIAAPFAADGIDELIRGFVIRTGELLRSAAPRRLRFHTTDAPGTWTLLITENSVQTAGGEQPVDFTVSGPAGALYLTLWNRRPPADLAVAGDESLLDLWRDRVQITWN